MKKHGTKNTYIWPWGASKLSIVELATKYFNNTEQDRKVFTIQLILQKTVYFSAKKKSGDWSFQAYLEYGRHKVKKQGGQIWIKENHLHNVTLIYDHVPLRTHICVLQMTNARARQQRKAVKAGTLPCSSGYYKILRILIHIQETWPVYSN